MAVVLLMPTLLFLVLSGIAVIPAGVALLRSSRSAAVTADAILLMFVVASHLVDNTQGVSPGILDILRLILIISFHEFSSLSSEVRRFETHKRLLEQTPEVLTRERGAFRHHSLSIAGVIVFAGVTSAIFYQAAKGASASLYTIYGVAAGLMVVIAFLFLLLNVASRRHEK